MGQTFSSPSLASLYGTPEPALTLLGSLVISYVAYISTSALIPRLRDDFVSKGLKGIDLLKGYPRDAKTGKMQGPELSVGLCRSFARKELMLLRMQT
jgi:UDP-N-acetylglucosamine--dolichyl-phosphate N-acetylglucosaminephosphotransferase